MSPARDPGPRIVSDRLSRVGLPLPREGLTAYIDALNCYLRSYGAPDLSTDPSGMGYLHAGGRRVVLWDCGPEAGTVVLASLHSEDSELLAQATVLLAGGHVGVVT